MMTSNLEDICLSATLREFPLNSLFVKIRVIRGLIFFKFVAAVE